MRLGSWMFSVILAMTIASCDKPHLQAPCGFEVLDAGSTPFGWASRVRDPLTGLQFVLIPAGTYRVGSRSTGRHDATRTAPISDLAVFKKPFYIATTEVSVQAWSTFVHATSLTTHAETEGSMVSAFVANDPRSVANARPHFLRDATVSWRHPLPADDPRRLFVHAEDPRLPAVHLNWREARAFCRHYGYELPTEIQWEVAATGFAAFDNRRFVWGDDAASGKGKANGRDLACQRWIWARGEVPADLRPDRDFTHDDGFAWLAPCGAMETIGFGLCDMHGNVTEWLLEDWEPDLRLPPVPPLDPSSDGLVKGGGFIAYPDYLRVRQRHRASRTETSDVLGFRPVINL